MPRRVPARGRGRETELCIILLQGELPKAEGPRIPSAELYCARQLINTPCERPLEQQLAQATPIVRDDWLVFAEHCEDSQEGLARGFVAGGFVDFD